MYLYLFGKTPTATACQIKATVFVQNSLLQLCLYLMFKICTQN